MRCPRTRSAASSGAALPESSSPVGISFVQSIHDAQIVHADDGMDHVEYELLVVNAFASPVTLSSVVVLDPDGQAAWSD